MTNLAGPFLFLLPAGLNFPPLLQNFDNTITLGAIIQIVLFLIAVVTLAVRIEKRISTVETLIEVMVKPMWKMFVTKKKEEDNDE